MFEKFHSFAETVIGRVVDFSQRRAWLVITTLIGFALVCAQYTINHVAINTDTEEMLSAELEWRKTYTAYKADFPYFADTIVIVVDGATPDIASDTAQALVDNLNGRKKLIEDIYYPAGDPFMRRHQFLYTDVSTLSGLIDSLSAAQPMLSRLTSDASAATLFELLTDAAEASLDGEDVNFIRPMDKIAEALEQFAADDQTAMSWQALILGSSDLEDVHREILIVKPVLDYSALLPAEFAIDFIRQTIRNLHLDQRPDVQVRLTGSAALGYDELNSVITGSQRAGTFALLMVFACLVAGLRSATLVITTLTTLIVGLTITAAYAVACVGTLNMISVAFAVLYVGLGVDFAIHMCLRYREMLAQYEPDFAVNLASRHVGVSLILCALTTAVGFFAFIPTAYRGVAELGIIAGSGMFISLIVTVVLVPALLHVLPAPKIRKAKALLPDAVASFPRRHSRGMLGGAAVVWVICSLLIPFTEFDSDPINLNDQNAESVLAYRDLVAEPKYSPLSVSASLDSEAELQRILGELARSPSIKSTVSLQDLIPDSQDVKLAMIEDLYYTLGDELEKVTRRAVDEARLRTAIRDLSANLQRLVESNQASDSIGAARRLSAAIADVENTLSSESTAGLKQQLQRLDAKLLDSFAGRIGSLRDALEAQSFDPSGLPEHIRQRWQSPDGKARLETFSALDLNVPRNAEQFVKVTQKILDDRATGAAVINSAGAAAVKFAFIQAFLTAFVAIVILLTILLRSPKEVAIVLTPLLLAGLLTSASSAIFKLPFNFANIIALPLLLGIGVDSALHMLHRYKTALPVNGNLLQTSTARAVFFSALTTVVSFGNLASSSHAGTASMGIMLTIGVVSTLICTLLVLPALLKQYIHHPQ